MTAAKATVNGTKPSTPRLRLVGVTLSLDVVDDDGEMLTPVQVQPIAVTAVQWPAFELADVLAQIERQLREPG